ncbi:hypothetical protein [Thiorhodococcus minor]|uniref:Uncharacterized protein n=1 Tax=Thiorhodococcus minor TaxID=57489 RepID=A0A6M0K404_9GAMM|nr:hypothetical protein [Thiorhodococcus minor]NEV64450.1 hypothetical protein [Thiorhodococcus minor]
MGEASTTVRLSKETIIQLQALSLPGESLSSVIQRAALALHTLETAPSDTNARPAAAVSLTERMDALESRMEQIERRCAKDRT